MAWVRTYTDEELVAAIAASTSWRGTLRELGLSATSSRAIASVRSQARRLEIDCSHFTGQRRWAEADLRAAVATAQTWADVAETLGLTGGSAVSVLRGHAARLGLDIAHLVSQPPTPASTLLVPSASNLARSGALLAAAWFSLCGCDVSWPLEPCRYDLLVTVDGSVRRVQVKTTTTRAGQSWQVYLSTTHRERRTYDPDEIDDFFIIDGDLGYYLIPVAVVGGLHSIHLSAYDHHRVPTHWIGA